MPATKEVRFYCDRCGAMYGTSGENGIMPERDQILLIMSAGRCGNKGWSANDPSAMGASLSSNTCLGAADLVIGDGQAESPYAPRSYCQVCPRCRAEFSNAMERLRQWWSSGKTMISAAPTVTALPKPASPRIAAARAVVRSRRGGG